ncbi:hypothetical protein AVV29_gp126 [Vibrio phage phi 3]|uniref:NADAR domain-containing protein n=1 Tax=Vibrio phage phi 3 TaxID=1589298 RepID=A0A0B5H2Y7_9CAUD|nr:hypothetical protein AVV29_gp126 [Vibrio phage phi 3]AJF40852.1 hypothetical protein SBVP3_0085 [Vibrio phage phi 3]
MEQITSFRGKYSFLSNMYLVPVEYNGIVYASSENLYQSFKSNIDAEVRMLAKIEPKQAKSYWKTAPVRCPNFFKERLNYMYIAVKAKFDQHPILKAKLLETGDAELLEGNWWKDRFWGVDYETLEGQNNLGKILMRLRDEYRSAQK